MKVLYLPRGEKEGGILPFFHRARRSLYFSDQDGFFEQSLYQVADVTTFAFGDDVHNVPLGTYDWLLINWKQPMFRNETERFLAIKQELDKSALPKALFVNAAQAGYLPSEEVLNEFDLIFKREPWLDKSTYSISKENQAKIRPTIIHCPFAYASRNNFLARTYEAWRPTITTCRADEAIYDVGFSGADAAEHTLRRDAWQRVVSEGFSHIGGLQPNPFTNEPIPESLRGSRFNGRAYRDSLCRAKINLALDGIGEYTFRHQELLYVGAFVLSGPSIRNLDLIIPLKENKHYVAFDDLDDMVAKIRYYLAHDTERLAIARAGRELFFEYYDPQRHGQQILSALESGR